MYMRTEGKEEHRNCMYDVLLNVVYFKELSLGLNNKLSFGWWGHQGSNLGALDH